MLSEFSKEKSIDLAETNLYYAQEFEYGEWIIFWKKVIAIIKESK